MRNTGKSILKILSGKKKQPFVYHDGDTDKQIMEKFMNDMEKAARKSGIKLR